MPKIDFSNIDLKNLACLISETLIEHKISAILVGGACVSIYSENRYQSYDLDFATFDELKAIEKALKKIGFKKKGRSFSHENCPYLIDFVNPPITIGHEAVHHFKTLKTRFGSLQLLKPVDSIKDRLAAYFHWNDMQALEQAILVGKTHKFDMKDVRRWAKKEGFLEKLRKIERRLR